MAVIACILWVGVIHPFREVEYAYTGNEGHEITRPLEVNESITQYFRATDNNLIQLEFAVDFDERYPKEGQLYFELLDAEGNAVYAEVLDYGQMPDYKYNGPIVNVRLKKGKEYVYRLTNLNVTENMPCAIYTTDEEMCSLKKGKIEFAGEVMEGELITKITANVPLDANHTLAICGCIGMVGFAVYEVLSRIEKGQKNKTTAQTGEENGEKKIA